MDPTFRPSVIRAALLGGMAFMCVASPAAASRAKKIPTEIEWAPTAPTPAPPPPADGAIFHANYGYSPLTAGARASQVGDIITIVLAERTQAEKTNTANTDRSGSISVTPPPTGPLSFLKKTDFGVGSAGTFAGKGGASQSNLLNGEVSVTITQVLPNGNMVIKGQKLLTLNRGEEQIRIQGIVRPADILVGNTVLSYQIADAHITYSGTGEIARASRQGWLGKIFSIVAPF